MSFSVDLKNTKMVVVVVNIADDYLNHNEGFGE
jgi:hypothetical protein